MKQPIKKPLAIAIALSTCLLTLLGGQRQPANAQFQPAPQAAYSFFGQQIPLTPQPNVIAVAFEPQTGTRGVGLSSYAQLEADLRGESLGTRGGRSTSPFRFDVRVSPLGDRYALVSVEENASEVQQAIRQQRYVKTTLPVLTVGSGADAAQVVLPNEVLLSLEPNLSGSEVQALLNRYGLEVIRPLQFSRDRYIVRSRRETGLAILEVANRLSSAVGVESATPNFIQSVPYRVQSQDVEDAALSDRPNATEQLQQLLESFPKIDTAFPSTLFPLAWHLDSTPQRGRLQPRTDIRANTAWNESDGGEGVVVAIIDSLIQWDHPDLAQNLYSTQNHPNRYPGEEYGWDFTSGAANCPDRASDSCVPGDPDTRISDAEIALLQPHLQNTFQLSDAELLETYSSLATQIRESYPSLTSTRAASIIRNVIRGDISSEFHGTWSAGVVAAHPQGGEGAIGVAPRAKILPVRVFGVEGEITTARLIEAVGYAADRGADVINMSLGSAVPDQAFVNQIFAILDEYPELVIIASAGNSSVDGVGFPAATPGVLSVGATNLEGQRTYYSSYGGGLDVVAPGGETNLFQQGGILTTGGTWVDGFWNGLEVPPYGWGVALDPMGKYVQVQGTSFSAPAVSGVVALMKGVNPSLGRDRLLEVLRETASYEGLTLTRADLNRYRLQREVGLTLMADRVSGLFPFPEPISPQEYFFGAGLVDAAAAVQAVR